MAVKDVVGELQFKTHEDFYDHVFDVDEDATIDGILGDIINLESRLTTRKHEGEEGQWGSEDLRLERGGDPLGTPTSRELGTDYLTGFM